MLRAERVVGHVPAEVSTQGKGFLARLRSLTYDILITSQRLLLIRQSEAMNTVALDEGERLEEEAESLGVPWRQIMDAYRWDSPPWQHYYRTAPDKLLSESGENRAIALGGIQAAIIGLGQEDDLDHLELRLANGEVLSFNLFMASGGAAARFLAAALGRHRVQMMGWRR